MILEIKGIDTFYGLGHILHGLSLAVAEGEAAGVPLSGPELQPVPGPWRTDPRRSRWDRATARTAELRLRDAYRGR